MSPVYRAVTTVTELAEVWRDDAPFIAIDTEGFPHDPWCLSFAQTPGEGFVVWAQDTLALSRLQDHLDEFTGTILMHNALWDLPVLRALGITVDTRRVVDTMIMAYLLRDEPQSLKELARKHYGMGMEEYMDVAGSADRAVVAEYIRKIRYYYNCAECEGTGDALAEGKKAMKIVKCPACAGGGLALPAPPSSLVWVNGEAKPYTPQPLGKRLSRILASDDPRKAWIAIPPEVREPVEKQIGELPFPSLRAVEPQRAITYAARDADATLRVFGALKPRITDTKLDRVHEIDRGILPMIDAMTTTGAKIDVGHFNALSAELSRETLRIEAELEHEVGRYVNPNSGAQLAVLLFHDLGLTAGKLNKSRTQPAVDKKALQALKIRYPNHERAHRIIDMVSQYRELSKINGTYADALPRLIDANGRVHTRFKLTRTETGRLASADPNLQNIPARTPLGRKIREGFIAERGMSLGTWDYDQIEMRILASESGDSNLLRVFREGLDIHSMTASLVFRVPIENVTKDQRTSAKNVGFGVVYGVTSKGLREQMELRGQTWSEPECQELIDLYLHEAYPGVGEYMKSKWDEAKETGKVTDMFGRIRYLPAATGLDQRLAAEALRQAGNMPIQSSAAGVLKLAMANIWDEALPQLHAMHIVCRPILNVHDELVFEIEEGAEEVVDVVISEAMREACPMAVPLTASGGWGANWLEAKEMA